MTRPGDFSEVERLARDLSAAPSRALSDLEAIAERGALNIKDHLKADAAASKHFKGIASSISYDRDYGVGRIGYEIGPDKERRGGALGNIAYFGGARGGGGTLDLDEPVRAEGERLDAAISRASEGWL